MSDRLRHLLQFLDLAAQRFREDNGMQLASSLAFTTLLSLVPLVIITLTLFTAFPGFAQFTDQVDHFVTEHMLPHEISSSIRGYVEQFSSNAGRLTALGTAFLAVISFLLMVTIERAFNIIWRVRRQRPLVQRVMMYWAILTLGPVLIGASVTMTSYLVSVSLGWVHDVPQLRQASFRLVPFGFTIAAFTMLYFIVPNRPVRLVHALIGGAVAGILFELMKRGFALYIANIPAYAIVYGAFAIIPIFLVWVYLSWVVALLGAIVTALLPDWRVRGNVRAEAPGTAFADALAVLRVLFAARHDAGVVNDRKISRATGIPYERCEAIMDELEAAGWAAPVGDHRWALVCDVEHIGAADVYRRFVFRTDRLVGRLEEENGPRIAAELRRLEHQLDVPLRELLEDRKEDAFPTDAGAAQPVIRSA
jgi:membrane protein